MSAESATRIMHIADELDRVSKKREPFFSDTLCLKSDR